MSFIQFLLLVVLVIGTLSFYSYSKGNIQIRRLNTISGPITNPLMGWAPWATIQKSNQPHTLVYADLTWRDFEPQEGHYDFDTFEKKQQLARWRQEGKRIIFRFLVDVPGRESHLDIPDWLFARVQGHGDYYDNEYGKGFSPDYSNPVFIEYHKRVMKALGERYGKDGFFAFIELGSLGHWGEWHTHPDITPLPPENVRNEYIYQYRVAFPGIYLLMRRPFSVAPRLQFGLYNDMTADPMQTTIWLDWIEHGGSSLQERDELTTMPNRWENAPIGGEQSPNLSNEQVYSADLEQTLQLLRKSHTTFIGPAGPYEVEKEDILQIGLNKVLTMIGYRLYLDHVQMWQRVLYGKSMPITFIFSNAGIAPIYYNWPTRLYVFDTKGNTIATSQVQLDLKKILPGKFYTFVIKMPIDNLKNGIYSLGIAIIDPITGQPGVKLANENTRQDLIQYIGSFEVKRLFQPNP